MRYLKLTVAYDGTDYCGWQVQSGQVSVQQRLEESWNRVTGETVRIVASGRTDGGVHAEGQVCSLATDNRFPTDVLVRAMNAETPFDISILQIEEATAGFHAIRDAVSKTYRYQIQFGRLRDPLKRRYWWHVPYDLDVEAMKQGAQFLIGRHDFASFQSAGAERNTTVRTITQLDLITAADQPKIAPRHDAVSTEKRSVAMTSTDSYWSFPTIQIYISADGFLYKMVRNIVGSLVRVGEGREHPAWISWILQQRNRQSAGQAAPAHGLFLQQVDY